MTAQEKEYTRVIAEFLGYPTQHYWWHHKNLELLDKRLPISLNEEICKFHEKYDWLIPVWVKFRDLDFSNVKFGALSESVYKINVGNSILNDPIHLAFYKLTEAIIWHNENKGEDEKFNWVDYEIKLEPPKPKTVHFNFEDKDFLIGLRCRTKDGRCDWTITRLSSTFFDYCFTPISWGGVAHDEIEYQDPVTKKWKPFEKVIE